MVRYLLFFNEWAQDLNLLYSDFHKKIEIANIQSCYFINLPFFYNPGDIMFTKKIFQTFGRFVQTPGKRNFFKPTDYPPVLASVDKKSWLTALHLETDKQNHLSQKSLRLSVKHRLSKQISAEEGNYPVRPTPDSPAYEIIEMKLLYGISQQKWEDFTSELVPEIVEALNLNEYRYLWPAYNIAVAHASPAHQVEIAEWIGRMHFLMDMVLQGESALAAFEPNKFYFGNEKKLLKENFLTLLSNLKNGSFSYEAMQALHPAFTSTFLHKVSRCPDFKDVARLAALTKNFASPYHVSVDSEELEHAIGLLPSSRMETGTFKTVLQLTEKIGTNHSRLFFNSHNRWTQHTQQDIREIDKTQLMNYIDNLYMDLILPELLRKHPNLDKPKFSEKIKQKFLEFVENSCSIRQLHFLQKEWHTHAITLESLKPAQPSQCQPGRFWTIPEEESIYPYDPLTQEVIYQFYRTYNLLPVTLKENSYQKMLASTDFQMLIDKIVSENTPRHYPHACGLY